MKNRIFHMDYDSEESGVRKCHLCARVPAESLCVGTSSIASRTSHYLHESLGKARAGAERKSKFAFLG